MNHVEARQETLGRGVGTQQYHLYPTWLGPSPQQRLSEAMLALHVPGGHRDQVHWEQARCRDCVMGPPVSPASSLLREGPAGPQSCC